MRKLIIPAVLALLASGTPLHAQEEGGFPMSCVKLDWTVTEDFAATIKGYPIENMKDGDPATAWAGDLTVTDEDGKKYYDEGIIYGDGMYGFKISIKEGSVKYIRIIPGYAKSKDAFKNNSRPIEIIIFDGKCWRNDGGEFMIGNESAAPIGVAHLHDAPEPQIINLPRAEEATSIWFCISDVVTGSKYYDNCISELEFYGDR